ncbi:MAG: radical SAM protein [Deltaproteobacteria bacterium]|nr:radical SAM protein [Deltaproteobacteria bacterium]MBW2051380.1 radical SAM protein [Deltaproteobacteria bacterium]MBW2142591.1 radical SAM protein [Deltaproteobacteria bacterium]MBW2324845.1 radical SAM protein [Deltaproteobacteria bacterium]
MPEKKKKEGVFKYIFGPAPSRRLGVSLGLDLVPPKTCTLDCLYCEVGRTTVKTVQRFHHNMAEALLMELEAYLNSPGPELDYITLAGSGEPTLNREIGSIIQMIKEIAPIKVAVLTNGSLLDQEEVRSDLALADLVVPSLDAASPETFQQLNRPHKSLGLERIINGLIAFREEFIGQIWLEILVVKGINDQDEELEALRDIAARIKPNRLQINTVFRPPADASAQPVSQDELKRITRFFGPQAEEAVKFKKAFPKTGRAEAEKEILNLVGRRPCSAEDLASVLALPASQVTKILAHLINDGVILREDHADSIFFRRV